MSLDSKTKAQSQWEFACDNTQNKRLQLQVPAHHNEGPAKPKVTAEVLQYEPKVTSECAVLNTHPLQHCPKSPLKAQNTNRKSTIIY